MNSLLNYFSRVVELPLVLAVKREIFDQSLEFANLKWSSYFKAPMVVRCKQLLDKLGLPRCKTSNVPLSSGFPPWLDPLVFFKPDFPIPTKKYSTTTQIIGAFKHLQVTTYGDYAEIYTDGSVFSEPTSTAAGITVIRENYTKSINWRLESYCSIFTAELFAINQALSFASRNIEVSRGLVIFTDSQSSINALLHNSRKDHVALIYDIQNKIKNLSTKYPVHVQYIPAHEGIEGNEHADLCAKAGHAKNISFFSPTTKGDFKRLYRIKLTELWEREYCRDVTVSGKGKNLFNCKSHPSTWKWASHESRSVEAALAKLRIGHVGIKAHQYRTKSADTDLCSCGHRETVAHFLLECPIHSYYRKDLKDLLTRLV